jgi:hypothetical protein
MSPERAQYSNVAFRILFALLGLLLLAPGVLQARGFRMSDGEARFVRAGVGVPAASRLLAGTAFFVGAVLGIWRLVAAGLVCFLLGSAAAEVVRLKLKRV